MLFGSAEQSRPHAAWRSARAAGSGFRQLDGARALGCNLRSADGQPRQTAAATEMETAMHPGTRALPRRRGFDQFVTTDSAGLVCHISSDLPYSLEHVCQSDVICLVLGSIAGTAQYDDGTPQPVLFRGDTLAYHPPGTRLRIDAAEVRHGFIAFSYPERFQAVIDDGPRLSGQSGNRENLNSDGVRHLAQYVRRRILSGERLARPEVQSLATLAWMEAARHLQPRRRARGTRLTDEEFRRVSEYVTEHIGRPIGCADIADAVGLPLRLVFDGVKARTGSSLYRFVTERRVDMALALIRRSDMALSEVASTCGFSSQQHMTSVFSQRVGVTPMGVRSGGRED